MWQKFMISLFLSKAVLLHNHDLLYKLFFLIVDISKKELTGYPS